MIMLELVVVLQRLLAAADRRLQETARRLRMQLVLGSWATSTVMIRPRARSVTSTVAP